MDPRFLTLRRVIAIHEDQIARYGGSAGIRDIGLLQSAIAIPKATFGGKYLHEDLYMMAAAYLYHIVLNHPFIDGNKRARLVAAILFLDVNGVKVIADEDEIADLVLAVAEGKTDKATVADFLKENSEQEVQ